MGNHASFVAITETGRHIVKSSSCFGSINEANKWLHDAVKRELGDVKVNRFWYMLGCEAQEYTPGEVNEVFFGSEANS